MGPLNPLTTDEIAQLEGQFDRIRQLLASLDRAMVEKQVELAQALAVYGEARIRVEIVKAEKATIVERARNLKTLLGGY